MVDPLAGKAVVAHRVAAHRERMAVAAHQERMAEGPLVEFRLDEMAADDLLKRTAEEEEVAAMEEAQVPDVRHGLKDLMDQMVH